MSRTGPESAFSHRLNRRALVGGAAATAGALSLGRSSLTSAQDAVSLTWGTWGNTGEIQRFKRVHR